MFGRRPAFPKTRDYKKDISQLQSLNTLTLDDLNKIRRYVAEYPDRIKLVESGNAKIKMLNKEIDRENEANERRVLAEHARREKEKDTLRNPIRDRQLKILDYLKASKVWLGGFEAKVGHEKMKLSHDAKPRYEEYLSLEKKWSDLRLYVESVPLPARKPHIAMKKPPTDYSVLKIAGATLRVFVNKFSLHQIDAEIEKRKIELKKDKEKFQEIKARATSKELEIRAQAKRFRSELEQQKRIITFCPYCESNLDSGNAHLDHIYPVSKGGQSTKRNLVFVCSVCNLKKKMHTLRVFVRDSDLDFDHIASRLEALGKDF
jgi:5-methylcytosine-specific restriction endonuclease McrA